MSSRDERTEVSDRTLFVVWVVVLLLGVFSLVMRYSHIGAFTFLTGYSVAAIQALLVALFFMDLYKERATVHIALAAAFSLVALLVLLTIADVLTRATPPLRNPAGTAQRYHG